MHGQDPQSISFNSYHQNQNQNRKPHSGEWGAENLAHRYQATYGEHNFSYINQDSGEESPRLWKNSPIPSPSPSRPLLLQENSRAEAIVRGQWELMEMVKNMPDDSYELSLKDMVEHQRSIESVGSSSVHQRAVVKVGKREEQSRKQIDRNLSLENKGMFLNMAFPFSFKSRKRDSSVGVSGKSERDWWRKKFRGSSDSDTSGISSTNSGSGSGGSTTSSSGGSSDTGRRKRRGLLSSCWPFLHSRSNKSHK